MFNEPIIQNSLAEEVYKRIRLSIFQNIYVPGQKLDIAEIAKQLSVSRQPVKEAINRLAQEGLVEIKNRVGSFIRKLSINDVQNIMSVRLMIEIFALSNTQLDPKNLRILEELVEQMEKIKQNDPFDYLAFNEIDMKFHQSLVALSNNELLVNMYNQLNAHYITARAFFSTAFERTLTKDGQHREIVNHLKQGNIDKAVEELREHIEHGSTQLVELLHKTI